MRKERGQFVRLVEGPDDIPRPLHRYVPGRTPRHPETWFDPIKSSVTKTTAPDALQHTAAFQAGLVYLAEGYHWECHEVLEAVWMQAPDPSPERDMTQALIQLANARLKLEMQRPRATRRLCEMVRAHLDRLPQVEAVMGVRVADIREAVAVTEAQAIAS